MPSLLSASSPSSADKRVGGSFRDPCGFVFVRDGRVLRQVNKRYQTDYDQLIQSGLYDALVADDPSYSFQTLDDDGE